MPIYEYKCRECGDKFEKLVRTSSGEKDVKCPSCESPFVQRQVSVCGFLGGGVDLASASSASS